MTAISKHPLYRVWCGMKTRCNNQNSPSYAGYGGRGIKVCEEWLSSSASFIDWAKTNGWEPGLEIDRIDNDGNYEPSNCRFVDRSTNLRNTRRNRILTHDGKTMCVSDWADHLGIPARRIHNRLFLGHSVEDALRVDVPEAIDDDDTEVIRIPCPCCNGTGVVEITGVYEETYLRLIQLCSAELEYVVANRHRKHFGCKGIALNNRLDWLEKHGFATSERYGRERRFRVNG